MPVLLYSQDDLVGQHALDGRQDLPALGREWEGAVQKLDPAACTLAEAGLRCWWEGWPEMRRGGEAGSGELRLSR